MTPPPKRQVLSPFHLTPNRFSHAQIWQTHHQSPLLSPQTTIQHEIQRAFLSRSGTQCDYPARHDQQRIRHVHTCSKSR